MQIGNQDYPFTNFKGFGVNAQKVIDYSHHEVHGGSSFFFDEIIALGNGATQDYLITTPNTTKWAHFGFNIDFNDAAGVVEMFEGADRTGTTLQTSVNRERNHTAVATTTIHKGQSGGTTDGTRISWKRTGSGKTSGGNSGTSLEIILKQNTKYLIRLTNTSTSTNNTAIEFGWYEHTNTTE